MMTTTVAGAEVNASPSFPEWQHRVDLGPVNLGNGLTLKATAGLHFLQGNRLPSFTVTGETRLNGREDSCGCLHDDISKAWPVLAPVIVLHLSDSDGQPTYAEANGWYWLAGFFGGAGERYHGASGIGAKDPEECLQIFANHVRVSREEARRLALQDWSFGVTFAEAKPAFVAWVSTQRLRWKAEAQAACRLLDTIEDCVSKR